MTDPFLKRISYAIEFLGLSDRCAWKYRGQTTDGGVRRAQLLNHILLVMLPVGFIATTLQWYLVPEFATAFFGINAILMWGVGAFMLNRHGYYRAAALLTLTMATLSCFISIVVIPNGSFAYAYLFICILLSGLLFDICGVLVMAILSITEAIVAPLLFDLPWPGLTPFDGPMFLFIMTLLWLIAMRHQTALENDRQNQLRESEVRFRILAESGLIGIVVGRDDGLLIEANNAFLTMVGYSHEDLESGRLNWRDLTAPEHREIYAQASETLRLAGEFKPFEKTYLHKDGDHVHAMLDCAPLGGDGSTSICFVLDLTERRRAEEEIQRLNADLECRIAKRTAELVAANNELEAFTYSASHDLRTPLRAIHGFSEVLELDYASKLDAEGRNYLARIRAASLRMAQLIDDLLSLSRIGRSELIGANVDMAILAREIAARLTQSEPARLMNWLIEPTLMVEGDSRLLNIMLENLINNAWKFTQPVAAPCIEFGVNESHGRRIFFIRDNGVGFDMAYSDKLFRPFNRLHRAGEFEGSGIGLSIVERVMHRHGGSVWAESKPNSGATFYFEFPRS